MVEPAEREENEGGVSNSRLSGRMIPFICRLQCFYPPYWHSHATGMESTVTDCKGDATQPEISMQARNRKRGGWKSLPCIIVNESCEKVASFGLLSNMIVYLTTQFNMKNVAAANVLNIWAGTSSLTPLLGAFISDSYTGRFWTIALASIISLMGMVILWLTAELPNLRPPRCSPGEVGAQGMRKSCVSASGGQLGLLFLALALMTAGAGGIRPCSLAFGADQLDQNTSRGRSSTRSFFNWYYFSMTVSFTLGLTVIVYIQDNVSWSWGFGIPAMMMLFSVLFFFLGAPLYIRVQPQGSVFTGFARVVVASFRKRHLPLPPDATNLYIEAGKSVPASADWFRFLNKAAIKTDRDFHVDGSVISPWRICTLQTVEELKSVLRIVPIWLTGVVIFMVFGQLNTFSVLQALTMERRLGPHFRIPAGSFGAFGLVTVSAWLPIYDRFVVPLARRYREGGITVLQRMGIGLGFSVSSMAVAGLVEMKRRKAVLVPVSALWLAPQYCLSGMAEAFNAIGQVEFYYEQFPESMRSIGVALLSCNMAIGNYLSSLIVNLVHRTTGGRHGQENWLAQNLNRGHLDYFYWLLACISFLNLLYFAVVSRWCAFGNPNLGGPDENPVEQATVGAVPSLPDIPNCPPV